MTYILTKSMSFILSSKNSQYHEILFAKVLVLLLNLSLFSGVSRIPALPKKTIDLIQKKLFSDLSQTIERTCHSKQKKLTVGEPRSRLYLHSCRTESENSPS